MKKLLAIFLCMIFRIASLASSEIDPCPFCNIDNLNKQLLFETEYLMILLDTSPRCAGHLLVIPKRHVKQAEELAAEEWQELALAIPKMVEVFKKAYQTDHYIILQKNGAKAFQSVFHVHFHLFPMQSQTWSEVFNSTPALLSDEEFEKQRDGLRLLFELE